MVKAGAVPEKENYQYMILKKAFLVPMRTHNELRLHDPNKAFLVVLDSYRICPSALSLRMASMRSRWECSFWVHYSDYTNLPVQHRTTGIIGLQVYLPDEGVSRDCLFEECCLKWEAAPSGCCFIDLPHVGEYLESLLWVEVVLKIDHSAEHEEAKHPSIPVLYAL